MVTGQGNGSKILQYSWYVLNTLGPLKTTLIAVQLYYICREYCQMDYVGFYCDLHGRIKEKSLYHVMNVGHVSMQYQ